MLIKIPTIERKIEDNKAVKNIGELEVRIDTSFLAHLKWEEQFQSSMNCDLSEYTERVRMWLKDKEKSKAHFVGLLKLLYCYVSSDKLPTFRDFAQLFDFEIADQILNKIGQVLEEVGKSISKN